MRALKMVSQKGCGNSLFCLIKRNISVQGTGTLGSAKHRQARLPDATSSTPTSISDPTFNVNPTPLFTNTGLSRAGKMPQDEALMERLKASLWFSIGKIVDEETARLNTTATPQFIGAMTEMVWAQIGIPSPLSSLASLRASSLQSSFPSLFPRRILANSGHRERSTRPRVLFSPCRPHNSDDR